MELLPQRMYYSEKSGRFALWSNRMGNASTVSSNIRDAASEAREGARDMGRAAGAASGDLQKDLQMLREDFSRLAQQVSDKVVEAVDESIKNRPYTTLAMALGLGFLFGATWRR